MNDSVTTHHFTLEPADSSRLAQLCGQFDEHLRQIEDKLDVQIKNRGNAFQLTGHPKQVNAASLVLNQLYEDTGHSNDLSPDDVHLLLRESQMNSPRPQTMAEPDTDVDEETQQLSIKTRKGTIKPRGENQKAYVRQIMRHDINFGIGPAGTGKTYLAVACAVEALEADQVRRILLVRPAVEAGEKLGFLPGDLAEKINPYLRPLYDALYEMLGFERVAKFIDRQVIEVAPLAYMRGRTLNNSFIILDESQNTTQEQMKMFLTRIGFGIVGSRVPTSSIRRRTISRACRTVRSSLATFSASDRVIVTMSLCPDTSISLAPAPVSVTTGVASSRSTRSAVVMPSGFEIFTRISSAGPCWRRNVPTVPR